MKISDAGLDLIKRFEGLRLTAYQDSADVWTIGWGHTKTAHKGMQITEAQAKQLLREDLAWAEKAVTDAVTVPLNQNQFDALVSFTFNVGAGALKKSTLLKLLNNRDYAGAANQLSLWVNAGWKPLAGLKTRRAAEQALFLTAPVAASAGLVCDLPTLKAPFERTMATEILQQAFKCDLLQHLDLALRAFQKQQGIEDDGVCGPQTWAKLFK